MAVIRRRRNRKRGAQPEALIELALRVVPLIAAISGVSYALGRLYLEAYQSQFGIPKTALQFNNADYLFSSFEMVVLSAVYVGILWVTLRRRLFNSLVDFLQSRLSRRRRNPARILYRAVWSLFMTGILFAALLLLPTFSAAPGLWGLLTGLCLGVMGLLVLSLVPVTYGASLRLRRALRRIRICTRIWMSRKLTLRTKLRYMRGRITPRPRPNNVLSKVYSAIGWEWMKRESVAYVFTGIMLSVPVVLFPQISQRVATLDAEADLESRLSISKLQMKEPDSIKTTDEFSIAWQEQNGTDDWTDEITGGGQPIDVRVVLENQETIYMVLQQHMNHRKKTHSTLHQRLNKARKEHLRGKAENWYSYIWRQFVLSKNSLFEWNLEHLRGPESAALKQEHQRLHILLAKFPVQVHVMPKRDIHSLIHTGAYNPKQ